MVWGSHGLVRKALDQFQPSEIDSCWKISCTSLGGPSCHGSATSQRLVSEVVGLMKFSVWPQNFNPHGVYKTSTTNYSSTGKKSIKRPKPFEPFNLRGATCSGQDPVHGSDGPGALASSGVKHRGGGKLTKPNSGKPHPNQSKSRQPRGSGKPP